MKRIVIGCDGTWQDLSTPDPTNVRRLCEAIEPHDGSVEQVVYYSPGIGTRNVFDKLTGGAFGWGINVEIASAYTFLCANYQLGDEIYLFGFSRGAYTVRSLAGLIYSCGILQRHEISWLPNAYALYRNLDTEHREDLALQLQKLKGHGQTSEDPLTSEVRINFLGVWDTVGALGVPDMFKSLKLDGKSRSRHQFHNTYLTPLVDRARHAVAIDECRKIFRHTEMNPLPGYENRDGWIRQVWFPGDHGCVGGGGDGLAEDHPQKLDKRPHSDAALAWMVAEIEASGPSHLVISADRLNLRADPTHPFSTEGGRFFRRMSNPLTGMQPVSFGRDPRPFCLFDDISEAARIRWSEVPSYRPKNLKQAHGASLTAI